jgi:hypothetical protein
LLSGLKEQFLGASAVSCKSCEDKDKAASSDAEATAEFARIFSQLLASGLDPSEAQSAAQAAADEKKCKMSKYACCQLC